MTKERFDIHQHITDQIVLCRVGVIIIFRGLRFRTVFDDTSGDLDIGVLQSPKILLDNFCSATGCVF